MSDTVNNNEVAGEERIPVSVRMPRSLVDRIDGWVASLATELDFDTGRKRSKAVCALCDQMLQAKGR